MKKSFIIQFLFYLLVFVVIAYIYILTKENFGSYVDFKSQLILDEAKININKFVLDETEGAKLTWRLNSEKANLFDKSNIINLETNKLSIFDDDTSYTIKSDLGVYDIDKKFIKLNTNVSVSSKEDFVFYTDELFYYIEDKILKSDNKILAIHYSNNIEIKGSNLIGNIDLKNFSLNKDIILESKNDNLSIKSNRVDFFTKSKKVVFYDKVKAIKKDIIIFSDKMDVYYNKEGYQEMHAFNNIRMLLGNNKKAYSKFAKIDDKKLILNEAAIFIVDQDEFKGDEIIYDINSKDIEISKVEGNVKKIR